MWLVSPPYCCELCSWDTAAAAAQDYIASPVTADGVIPWGLNLTIYGTDARKFNDKCVTCCHLARCELFASQTEPSDDTVFNCVLNRGVWVIFLFSAFLMVITLVHFLLGVVAERAVCEPLQSPNDNQLLALVDKMVRLDKFFNSEVEINVSSIIRCVNILLSGRNIIC